MHISSLDYSLPKSFIAQHPVTPRDTSKMMVIHRNNKTISNKTFSDIYKLLSEKDVLVLNKTKVFPARLIGRKHTGGKVEILLLNEVGNNIWRCIYKGKFQINSVIYFNELKGNVINVDNNIAQIQFAAEETEIKSYIEKYGKTPLPPYIKSDLNENCLRDVYQTVYAKSSGSVAAPTAGFHFTKQLLNKLVAKGVQIEYITLHVGLGTFLPIKNSNIKKHIIHKEEISLSANVAKKLNQAKTNGKNIIAVGTTTVRVLESCSNSKGLLKSFKGKTDLFIYPPYKYKFVNAMITNFHLPRSTLLALVSAFVSHPNTPDKFAGFEQSLMGKAYYKAKRDNYRFYSFGDTCFIL